MRISVTSFGRILGCITAAALFAAPATSFGGTMYHDLASSNFKQDWTDTSLITTDHDWSGVPSIEGYRGDNLTTLIGVDPQTILADGSSTPLNVIAQNLTTNTSGSIGEFELANPTVGFQGSATADAPFLILYMDATGRQNVKISYTLRDIDATVEQVGPPEVQNDAIQRVALHYRIGTSGNFTNVPSAYVADATTAPGATQVTFVSASLPAWDNVAQLQFRIMTTNAAGADEYVGVDDICVMSVPEPATLALVGLAGLALVGVARRRS